MENLGENLRKELSALFGIRWDKFIEWAVIAWLSAWFWTSAWYWFIGPHGELSETVKYASIPANQRFVGPGSGIEKFMLGIEISPADWLIGFLTWLQGLQGSAHNLIYWITLLAAVLASVTSVRSYKHTGLRVLALFCTAVACEVQGSFSPILWVLLIAFVPTVVACLLDLIDRSRKESKNSEYQTYYTGTIITKFLTRIMFLFLEIPLAPLLVFILLVTSFRTNSPRFTAEEIVREVGMELKFTEVERGEKSDPLIQAASMAAFSLAGNQSQEARNILSYYDYLLWKRRDLKNKEEHRKHL